MGKTNAVCIHVCSVSFTSSEQDVDSDQDDNSQGDEQSDSNSDDSKFSSKVMMLDQSNGDAGKSCTQGKDDNDDQGENDDDQGDSSKSKCTLDEFVDMYDLSANVLKTLGITPPPAGTPQITIKTANQGSVVITSSVATVLKIPGHRIILVLPMQSMPNPLTFIFNPMTDLKKTGNHYKLNTRTYPIQP